MCVIYSDHIDHRCDIEFAIYIDHTILGVEYIDILYLYHIYISYLLLESYSYGHVSVISTNKSPHL